MKHASARALAAAAAGALALLATVAPSASATTPIACATGAPLGAAQGWTEFVAGNGQRGSESEGSVAYGGNVNGMTVGTRLSSGQDDPTLVVAGTATGWFNLQSGSAYVPNRSGGGVNFNGGGHYLTTNPIDFTAAFADLRDRSASWSAVAPNGTAAVVDSDTTETPAGGNVLLLRGSDPRINVFSVTPAQLTGIRATYVDVPAGATALINVSGTNVTVNGETRFKHGGAYHQATDDVVADKVKRTIWNFAAATSVRLAGGATFGGTILAPNATVEAVGVAANNGQVIAASFKSDRETHLFPFPADGCVPGGGTPPGPTSADVAVTKTASDASPKGGDTVTYTLAVRNDGPDTAKNVVVTDALPPGVTFSSASSPCTRSGGIVTCAIGDLAAGATKTLTIKVTADPIAAVGPVEHPGATHLLPVAKVEQQVDLEPGDAKTVTLSCPAGGVLTDGSIRTDAVDQGTGALTDVRVLSARTTGVSTWEAVVRNDAEGRAQAKAFAVCLPARTESAGGHAHALTVSDPVTVTQPLAPGDRSVTVSCPAATTPIVPGWALQGGSAVVTGSEPVSGGWRFDVAVSEATTATFSVRCLDTAVATADDHTHDLKLTHVVEHVTVPAGQVVEGQVTCPDDAKGIVGTWLLPPGVFALGNDPRPKTRAFKLVNMGGAPATAMIDLECVGDRTSGERAAGPKPKPIVNTATVGADTDDPDPSNNASSATITVTGGAARVGKTAKAIGARAGRIALRAAR